MPVLDVKDLKVEFTHRRGTLKAIDGVSFSIRKGEVLGVVGESGAGKSLTGSAIIGLIEPPGRRSGGEITLNGQRIDTLPSDEMRKLRGRKIGMVFQDPLTSLNPLFTIEDQLVETILLHHPHVNAKAKALELLNEVGIPAAEARLSHYPHQFSGGQRQRIVLALALCAEPDLLIADEPTTALDVSVQAQIIRLLKKLCRERGTAVMLITHDMGVIAEIADRVAVMYAGRIAEIGAVKDVIQNPRHPYTKGLMGAIPSIKQENTRLLTIPGSMPRLNAMPQGCAFHPRCASAFAKCLTERPEPINGVACHLGDAS
jgi:peptide/nickel transport system ATP-binding protein